MRQTARSVPAESQLLFLPGVFNETLSLMYDAHYYFQTRGAEEQASIEPENRVVYAREMSRVTLRLTSVMAWLMVRRAIYAGRIDETHAGDDYRLNGRLTGSPAARPDQLASMPYYLNYLSDRTRTLYERIERLDELAYGTKH